MTSRYIAICALAVALLCPAAGRAQTGAAQGSPGSAATDSSGGVLEIAPKTPPAAQSRPQPPAASSDQQNPPEQRNPDDQGNDIELYRTYSDSEHAAGHSGPLPYLGISVHAMTVAQPDGTQRAALE